MGRLQAPLYLTGAYLYFWESCYLAGQPSRFLYSQVDTYPSHIAIECMQKSPPHMLSSARLKVD